MNLSPRWGFGHSFRYFPGRCPGLSHDVPLALNTYRPGLLSVPTSVHTATTSLRESGDELPHSKDISFLPCLFRIPRLVQLNLRLESRCLGREKVFVLPSTRIAHCLLYLLQLALAFQ